MKELALANIPHRELDLSRRQSASYDSVERLVSVVSKAVETLQHRRIRAKNGIGVELDDPLSQGVLYSIQNFRDDRQNGEIEVHDVHREVVRVEGYVEGVEPGDYELTERDVIIGWVRNPRLRLMLRPLNGNPEERLTAEVVASDDDVQEVISKIEPYVQETAAEEAA